MRLSWFGGLLLALLLTTRTLASPVRVAWDYPAAVEVTAFVVRHCALDDLGCFWQPVQVLEATARQAQVDVPRGTTVCLQVVAVRGSEAEASINLCAVGG